jgi:hypothetical protein
MDDFQMDDDLLAQLQSINDGNAPADDPKDAALATLTRTRMEMVWGHFEDYFASVEDTTTLAGSPTSASDYLRPEFAAIDFPTAKAFIVHWASGSKPLVDTVPSVKTAVGTWHYFKIHLQVNRGTPFDATTSENILAEIRGRMLEDGLLSKSKRGRPITDSQGLKALAEAVLSVRYATNDTRTSIQFLFWMSIAIQTAVRVGSCFYDQADLTDAPTMVYENFTIHIRPGQSSDMLNELSLTFHGFPTKTGTNENDVHVLRPQSELWRDPTFLFLVLATMDDALPASVNDLLSPEILKGKTGLDLKVKPAQAKLPVCRPTRSNSRAKRDSWSTGTVRLLLATASRLAGFASTLTPHAIRRMVAIFLRISGE